MDMDEYQRRAAETAIYPADHRVVYPALGLASEAGEVASRVRKSMRDGTGYTFIADEVGDILWYCAAIASDLGVSLGDIAIGNLAKLADRKELGVLGGSGDSR